VHINSNLNAHSYGKSRTKSEPFLGSVAIQFLLGIGVCSLYTHPAGGGNSGSINGYLYNTLTVTECVEAGLPNIRCFYAHPRPWSISRLATEEMAGASTVTAQGMNLTRDA
jgi:hypothetical protein